MNLTQQEFECWLGHTFTCPVKVAITNNKTVYFSFKQTETLKIRLHNIFLQYASEAEKQDIIDYINGSSKGDILNKFISKYGVDIVPELITQGKVWDLQDIFNRLNSKYFDNKCKANITWKKPKRKGSKSINVGLYNNKNKTIYINDVLDSLDIAWYYLEYVVFHEMAHSMVPFKYVNNRQIVHSKEFYEVENKYYYIKDAKNWEKQNIKLLLKNNPTN